MADDLFQVVKIGSTLFVMINKGMPETVECFFLGDAITPAPFLNLVNHLLKP